MHKYSISFPRKDVPADVDYLNQKPAPGRRSYDLQIYSMGSNGTTLVLSR